MKPVCRVKECLQACGRRQDCDYDPLVVVMAGDDCSIHPGGWGRFQGRINFTSPAMGEVMFSFGEAGEE